MATERTKKRTLEIHNNEWWSIDSDKRQIRESNERFGKAREHKDTG
jgi:hypothetical protein